MKTFLLITAILAFLAATSADECAELDEKLAKLVCDHENFDEYYKCIKDRKEVRRKRQLICPLTGMPINQVVPASVQNQPSYVQPIVTQDVVAPIITQAIAQNQNQPSYVQPIVTQDIIAPQQLPIQQLPIQQIPIQQVPIQQIPIQQVPIQQVPIQQTVQSQGGSFVPRYIVQASPDFINKNVEIVGQNETLRHSQRIPAGSNVTTVFRLNNYINNTNHINVPTHINSTNINNITIFTNSSDKFGLGATTNGPCCLAVQPKRCHTTPSGPRCHHKRHKTCGSQCTSRIIHVSRSNCGHGGCDVGYVPQPSPRCVYTDYWPYVQCGHRRRDPCDGCYDYGDPYYGSPPECSGCYDDGFEYGQLYRRGPVLRPFNRPQPPCHISGTCDDDFDEGFNRDPPEVFEEEENDSEIENDLGMVLHKCKVVSDDGTVSIKNCTFNQDNNPYASAPSFGDENARRIRSHQPIMAPPMPYYSPYGYPPPYPPMYPPMPMFYPPPPPPPRSMRRHHHKHPKKEETYEPPREIPEDDEEVVEN